MANHDDKHDNHEESSPLLGRQVGEEHAKKAGEPTDVETEAVKAAASPVEKAPAPGFRNVIGYGWTADGLPLAPGSVVGEPMRRTPWNSSILACLGRNDDFCGSDLEVCLLGSVAPCLLYGSNAERLESSPGNFASHCLSYTGLYLLGSSVFGGNCLAPLLSYGNRTAIRRKFNLEGSCEALHRSCGCCGCFLEDEEQREQCETACDFATHFFCHTCALCQEGREVRRRLPHPGFNAQPILVMIPPGEQSMGRRA